MARRHRVSTESLAQWNRVAVSASFKAGESVLLFLPAKAAGASNGKAQKRPAAAVSPRPTPQKATSQKRPSGNEKKAESKR
jgi:membrane-bound lytic murein transglycosylase D